MAPRHDFIQGTYMLAKNESTLVAGCDTLLPYDKCAPFGHNFWHPAQRAIFQTDSRLKQCQKKCMERIRKLLLCKQNFTCTPQGGTAAAALSC